MRRDNPLVRSKTNKSYTQIATNHKTQLNSQLQNRAGNKTRNTAMHKNKHSRATTHNQQKTTSIQQPYIVSNQLHRTFSQHPNSNLPFNLDHDSIFQAWSVAMQQVISLESKLSPLNITCRGWFSDFYPHLLYEPTKMIWRMFYRPPTGILY
jgi:hypothetical protein